MKSKKTMAALLSAVLAVSLSVPALAAPGSDFGTSGEITGEGDIKNPVISYILPTDLNFALDAFGMGDASGSMVYSPGFDVINLSEVAIRVAVKADLTLASDVVLKTSPADVTVDDPAVDSKDLYMELVGQKVTGFTSTVTDGVASNNVVTKEAISYDADDATTPGALTTAKAVLGAASSESGYEKPTLMTLALQKSTYDSSVTPHKLTGVADKTGAASLRFAGSINPNAKYKGKDTTADVIVKAVFDVRGLTDKLYASMITDNDELDAKMKAANVYSVGAGAAAEAAPTIADATYTAGQAVVLTVDMGGGDLAATDITSVFAVGTEMIPTYCTWDATAHTITFTSANAAQVFTAASTEVTVTYQKADTTTDTITVTVTRA